MIAQAGTSLAGSYQPNGVDTINLQNGALVLDIPLLSYPQLGNKLKFSFSLKFSPTPWYYDVVGYILQTPITYQGNWYDSPPDAPSAIGVTLSHDQALGSTVTTLNYPCTVVSAPCPPPANGAEASQQKVTANLYSIITADRAVHNFAITNGSYRTVFPTLDGSNLLPVGSGLFPPTVLDPNGITYTPPSGTGGFTESDSDGNTITVTSSGWMDSVGRQLPGSFGEPGDGRTGSYAFSEPSPGIVSTNLGNCAAGASAARVWVVPGPNAGTSTYTFCFTPMTANTTFATVNSQPSINTAFETLAQGSGSYLLLTQVVLPNGTSYSFTYDNWLNVTSLTLPTGGSISYGWTTMQWLDLTHQQSRVVSTRTVHNLDGTSRTWNYTLTDPVGVNLTSNMLITDPDGNDENHAFGGTQILPSYSSASQEIITNYIGTGTSRTLLKTTTILHSFVNNPFIYPVAPAGSPDSTEALSLMGPLISSTTAWAATNQVQQTVYSSAVSPTNYTYYDFNYNTSSQYSLPIYAPQTCYTCWNTFQPQTVSEYDYGNGAPGSLLRTTTTQYQWQQAPSYQSADLIRLPYSTTVADGSGKTLSTVLYKYDEANGSPQGILGNLTTVSTNNTSANTASHIIYNSQGVPTTMIDGNGNQTFISAYQCSGLFPQTVVAPYHSATTLAETVTYGYDCNTGALNTSKDANGEVTTYAHNDSLGRLTGIKYPDNGSVTISYNGDPTPPKVTQTVATGQNEGPITTTTLYDGFGRVTETQLNSDPLGADLVDTTYDPVGRVQSVSNPYRSRADATYGVVSYAYDGLGRPIYECMQDNGTNLPCVPGKSYIKWQYSGNLTSQTDQVGNTWQRTSDGLGRLTQVVEPNNSTTQYSYDGLSDLTGITQSGVSGETPRTRSFTYDALGRLISATNPETGKICYGTLSNGACSESYDGNGNLLSKTDARGIVTSYGYDALNRLLSKTYSTGTASACYQYDNSSLQASGGNLVGRETNAWTQLGACPSAAPTTWTSSSILSRRSILAYDAVGRVHQEQQCTKASCASGTSYAPSYTYDLAGNVLNWYNGVAAVPITLINGYDGAGHLSSINSSSPQYPTLFSSPTYTAAGGLNAATYGIGLAIVRAYDSRLRITGETDTGGSSANPAPGTAKITITGTDHTQ